MKNIVNHKVLYTFLGLIVVSLLIFHNSLSNGYNMDDSLVLTNNHLIDDGNILSVFTEHSYQSNEYNFAYRPFTILSFYIENLIFGKSPFVSHSINLALYSILNCIVFLLLYKTTNDISASIIITLLFLTFPLHTEVVDNIKNRDELFVSIVGFLSFYLSINSIIKKKNFYLIFVFFLSLIGVFFKESFLIFPLIISISAVLFYRKESVLKKIKVFAKFIIITSSTFIIKAIIVSIFVDKSLLNRTFEFFESPLFFASMTERILPAIYIMGYYISLLFFPFKLSYYYGYNTIHFNDYLSLNFVFGILVITVIPLIGYYLYKKHTNINTLIIAGIILLTINLLAISNIVRPLPGIVAERLILNGSLGYCVLLFYSLKYLIQYLNKITIKRELLILSSFVIICSFGAKTYARNKVWKSEITLYSHDIKNVPNSVKANEMLANKYFKKYYDQFNANYLDLSEQSYLNALNIYPKLPATLNNLGTINFIRKNYNDAITYYTRATKLKDKPITHYNLAECYKPLNRILDAKNEYEIALINNPNIPNIFSAYKNLVIDHLLIPEGMEFLSSRMLIKYKNNLNTYLLLVDLSKEIKDYKSMLKYLIKANEISPKKEYLLYIKKIENYLNKNK